jgi:hypothetical protein
MAAWLAGAGSLTRRRGRRPGPARGWTRPCQTPEQDADHECRDGRGGPGHGRHRAAGRSGCGHAGAGRHRGEHPCHGPAISVWKAAGRLGRQLRLEPARLVSPNQSAAYPNRAAWSHVAAAGSDRQVIRSQPRTSRCKRQPSSAGCADPAGLRRGSAAVRPAAAKTAVSAHRAASAVIITAPGRRCRGRGTRSRAAVGPAGSGRATGRCRAASPGRAGRPNRCGRPGPPRAGRR